MNSGNHRLTISAGVKAVGCIALFLTGLLFSNYNYAQPIAGSIDSVFSWTKPDEPGCVCAVSHNGDIIYNRAFGLADLEKKIPLSTESVFDIGSTHKQFIAAAALLLVQDGKLSLTEGIHKYIPELPQYGYKITLDHLLTHTSGIRDWTGLMAFSAEKDEALNLILRQKGLNFKPGEEWSYSNSGYVLVKEIISRVSGKPFGAFVKERLFDPLGMKSTRYSVDMRDFSADRALAYEKDKSGEFQKSMRLDEQRGGGGVLSNTGDLLKWNEALADNSLGRFVTEKLHEPAKLNNGRKLVYGRGMMLDPYRGGTPMFAHSGGAAGYSTWLGRFPEQKLSIAVLCNVEPTSASSHALRIADLFLPQDLKELEGDGPPPAIPEDIDLTGKLGMYINEETGDLIQLIQQRGFFRIAGGPGLVAIDKNRFRRWGAALQFMSQDAFEINFPSDEIFETKSMEGNTDRYRKVKSETISPEVLQSYAGVYESSELGAEFNIAPSENSLLVALSHSPERKLEFKPVGSEIFQWNGRMVIRFHRNSAGEVEALDYSNPVFNKISFRKTGK